MVGSWKCYVEHKAMDAILSFLSMLDDETMKKHNTTMGR
jgi:hypothetical protein